MWQDQSHDNSVMCISFFHSYSNMTFHACHIIGACLQFVHMGIFPHNGIQYSNCQVLSDQRSQCVCNWNTIPGSEQVRYKSINKDMIDVRPFCTLPSRVLTSTMPCTEFTERMSRRRRDQNLWGWACALDLHALCLMRALRLALMREKNSSCWSNFAMLPSCVSYIMYDSPAHYW